MFRGMREGRLRTRERGRSLFGICWRLTPGGVTSGVVEKYTLDEDEGDHDRDNGDGEDERWIVDITKENKLC
jgi:hypothetical protein